MNNKLTRTSTFRIEDHKFETFIPVDATHLVVGTFPTHEKNFKFNWYYSGERNLFWSIIGDLCGQPFKHGIGKDAITERKAVLTQMKIGITDMVEKCYRRNELSTDENIFPIILRDIYSILKNHPSINSLVFTSRTEVFGPSAISRLFCFKKGSICILLNEGQITFYRVSGY